MTLHVVIIHINSVLNKDKNHYYYNKFLEKCSYQLTKNNHKIFFYRIIMVKFGKTKIAKENFYAAKKRIKIWDVNVDNKVISKLVKTKTKSKYLIGYSEKDIRPLVLIMPKTSGYVKTFQVENKSINLCLSVYCRWWKAISKI